MPSTRLQNKLAVLRRLGALLTERAGHLHGPIRGLAHLERNIVGILSTDHPSSVYFLVCLGITQEAGTALTQSSIISGLSIAYRVAQVVFEMRKEKLGLCGYLQSLIEMGAGLPLRAISIFSS